MNKQALSLAIFIAGAYPAASSALGLGDIESNSSLNQPLRATIDLLSAAPTDASQIQVRLAPPDVFNRVGVARPDFLGNLRFTPTVQGGKPVILVTSDAPIQEPFVNFLLEVSWPQGQLLKEYTVILEPSVLMQPGSTVAGEAAVRAEPKAAGNVRRPASQASARASAQPAASASQNRTYRVKPGDTLFRVASRLQQQGVTNDQMMMALFRANPGAFIENNINNLRAGSLLKAPASGAAAGISRAEARRQIRQQNAEWREFRKALAGRTVPQQSTGTQSTAKPANNAGQTANNTPQDKARLEVLGAQTGGGAAKDAAVAAGAAKLAEIEKQLALANESLAARQNENNELKSRVTDLESMLGKKNRLLALRDNQLAELQKQLADNGIKVPALPEMPDGQGAGDQQPVAGSTNVGQEVSTPDQGKDIQTHMANVTGKDNNAILRGEQPVTPAQPVASAPDAARPADGGTSPQPVAPPTAVPSGAPAEGSSSLVPLKPVETTPPKPATKPAVVPVSPANVPVADKKPAPVFADQAPEGNDLLGLLTSPLALKIGAGSLALLLLLWLLGRRRKPDDADLPKAKDRFANLDDDLAVSVVEDETLDLGSLENELDKAEQRGSHGYGVASRGQADPFGIRDDHGWDDDKSEGSAPTSSSTPTAEPGGEDDLLTEANVYIAYGLYQQAESELKKGIERDPDKLEYRHKLLECYFAANNREAFDNQAQQFASMNGANKEALWKSISDWGHKISPDNKLYQGEGVSRSSVAATVATALGGVAAAGAAAVASADDDSAHVAATSRLQTVEPPDQYGQGYVDTRVDSVDDDFGDLDLGELDFDDIDLDKLLQEDDSADAGPAVAAQPAEIPALPELHNPDIGGLADHSQEEAGVAPVLEDETFELDDLEDDLDLDFDLDLPGSSPKSLADIEVKKGGNGAADNDADLFDFSPDQDDSDTGGHEDEMPAVAEAMPAVAAAAVAASSATNLNLHLDNNTGLNRILPKDTFYAPISEEDKDWLGDIDDALSFLDFPDEEIDLHEAHISTKLDLARAYLDMGDIEGARSTLEEVMVEGNDDQRREAEVLLHQTG